MFSAVFLILLFLILVGLVSYLWIRERRYLKKKTSEAMSEGVWKEVVNERETALKRRRLFRETLERTKKRG